MIFDSSVSALEYVVVLLAVYTLCVAALALLTYVDSDHGIVRVGNFLLRWIAPPRMRKMLVRRDVDMPAYFRMTPISEMKQQARNCDRCTHKGQCDEALDEHSVASANPDFSFCANSRAMGMAAPAGRHDRPVTIRS